MSDRIRLNELREEAQRWAAVWRAKARDQRHDGKQLLDYLTVVAETRDEHWQRADAAERRLSDLQEALAKAVETFEEMATALRLLNHPTLALAAEIALDASRAVLAEGEPPVA